MSDGRYTEQTAQLVMIAMHDADCHDRKCSATAIGSAYGRTAHVALTALADAGLLVLPGTEERTEWRKVYDGGKFSTPVFEDAEITKFGDWLRPDGQRESRTVWVGPWRPISEGDAGD